MNLSLQLAQLRNWGIKGGMAILDQGIFSGSNFLLTLLSARWLSSDQYGAYAISFSILTFFLQLLVSSILEPMSVIGPSSYEGNLINYLKAQVRIYFVLMGCAGLLFAISIIVSIHLVSNGLIFNVLIAIGIALAFMLLPWMLRRIFYVLARPHIALFGSIVYSVSLLILIYAVKRFDVLTSTSIIIVVALAGSISGIFLLLQLKNQVNESPQISFKHILKENWRFGRWVIIAGLLIAITGQLQIYLAGSMLGLKEAGVAYALQAFSQPMTLSITATMALITPRLASVYAKGDYKRFRKEAFTVTMALVCLAIAFELFLFLFSVPLEGVIYGGKFLRYVNLIPIWGLCPVITSLMSGMQYSLQAAKLPISLLIACLFWLPSSLGFGLLLIPSWGLWGVTWSAVLGYLVLALALTFLYWYWLVQPYKRSVQN